MNQLSEKPLLWGFLFIAIGALNFSESYGQEYSYDKFDVTTIKSGEKLQFANGPKHIYGVSSRNFYDNPIVVRVNKESLKVDSFELDYSQFQDVLNLFVKGSIRSIVYAEEHLIICHFGIVSIIKIDNKSAKVELVIQNEQHLGQVEFINNSLFLFECYPRSLDRDECENTRLQKFEIESEKAIKTIDTNLCIKGTFYGIRVTDNFCSNDKSLFVANILDGIVYKFNENLQKVDSFVIPRQYWISISEEEYKYIYDNCLPNHPKECYYALLQQDGQYSRVHKIFATDRELVILFSDPGLEKGKMRVIVQNLDGSSLDNEYSLFSQRVEPKKGLIFNETFLSPALHSSNNYYFTNADTIVEIRPESFVPKFGITVRKAKKQYNEYYKSNNPNYSIFYYNAK